MKKWLLSALATFFVGFATLPSLHGMEEGEANGKKRKYSQALMQVDPEERAKKSYKMMTKEIDAYCEKILKLSKCSCSSSTNLTPHPYLNLTEFLKNDKEAEYSNTVVAYVCNKYPDLGHLNLNNCTEITTLKPVENLKELKSLYVINCPQITTTQKEDLSKSLPNTEIVFDTNLAGFIYFYKNGKYDTKYSPWY